MNRCVMQVAVNEEVIRQKYQGEIEQLRALTEKGMSTMESSHKRMIQELEEKHNQDLTRLQVQRSPYIHLDLKVLSNTCSND